VPSPPAAALALGTISPVDPVHQVSDLSCQVGGQLAGAMSPAAAAAAAAGRGWQRRCTRGPPRCHVGKKAAQQRLDGPLLRPQSQGTAKEAVQAPRQGLRRRLCRNTQLGRPSQYGWHQGPRAAAAAAAAVLRGRGRRQQGVQLGHGQPGADALSWLPLAAAVRHSCILYQLGESLQQILRGRLVRCAPAQAVVKQCGSKEGMKVTWRRAGR
jgi:hypothetical protein